MTGAEGAGLALFAGLLASFASVAAMRSWALRKKILDLPNERSSHALPTPRGGGIGLILGMAAALGVGACFGVVPGWGLGALALGLGIAWLGWEDDRRGLSARLRLAAHFAFACAWLAYCGWRLAPAPPIWLASWLAIPPPLAWVFGAFFIAWTTNLFNFMDGIDGIAGAQAAAVGLGAAALAAAGRGPAPGSDAGAAASWLAAASPGSIAFVWLAMAAASAGFLAWNWSPARIFLGDAGSGFLGFFIAILAFRWEAERPGALGLVCVLNAAFIVDATWTLAARAWRRRPPSQAHRSHAYQIAARRLGSHAKVSLAVGAYDLGILLPLALLAASGRIAPIVAFLAGAAPVAAACAWLGAGREG